ncbi:insulinase family protein [Candidatus Beckwithbacteria bacterium]|nr:insulinase family protein [Candidatus Beckwithbacteria bacterium]
MNKIKTNTFKNNLQTIYIPIPSAKSATVLILVKAGTRYEQKRTNGISHFLEHMVFKGTKNFPSARDLAVAVDNIGGEFNAFTSKEYTGFYVKSAVEHLDLSLKIISELVFSPLLPKEELERERGVILEEIKMYEDDPGVNIYDYFEEVCFPHSSLGWDTKGLPKNIHNLQRKDFTDYLDYMYSPNRMVLAIAGGIKTDKRMHDLVLKYFGQNQKQVIFTENSFTFQQTEPKIKIIEKDTQQTHLIYGFRTEGRLSKDRYILLLLATILGSGMSSRFFTEIREKRGLAYAVGTTRNNYKESGYLALKADTSHHTAQQVLELANVEFEKIKKKKIGEKELKKAKEFIKGHMLLGFEDSMEVADFYATDLLLDNKIRDIDAVLRKIDQVSSSDILRVANKFFIEKNKNMAAIGKNKNLGI